MGQHKAPCLRSGRRCTATYARTLKVEVLEARSLNSTPPNSPGFGTYLARGSLTDPKYVAGLALSDPVGVRRNSALPWPSGPSGMGGDWVDSWTTVIDPAPVLAAPSELHHVKL